jgi:flagellar biosynthetic protein FlhB
MTVSHAEKVFPASSRKRRQAREDGQVVVSPDLLAGIFLLAVTSVLHFCGHRLLGDTAVYLQWSLEQIQVTSLSDPSELRGQLVEGFGSSARYFLVRLWPFWLLSLSVILTGFVQTRGLIHWASLKPDINRINPATGIKKFAPAELCQRMLVVSIKLVGLAFIAWTWTMKQHELESHTSLAQQTQAELDQVVTFLFALSGGLLAWGIIDYFWRRFRFDKQLRMSARELAEDQKQFEPDPNVKQGADRLRQQLTSEISLNRETDLLITDGLASSVLLRYEANNDSAPMIVLRHTGSAGVHLLQRCMQIQLQIHESVELQQELLNHKGSVIPASRWPKIAEIYAKRSSQQNANKSQTEPEKPVRVG